MARILVDPEVLESVARAFAAGYEQTSGQITSLKGQLEQLDAQWEGGAKAKFQEHFAEWEKQTRLLSELLTAIASELNRHAENFRRADNA